MAKPNKLSLTSSNYVFPEVPSNNIINDIGIASSPVNMGSHCLKEVKKEFWRHGMSDQMSELRSNVSELKDSVKFLQDYLIKDKELIEESKEEFKGGFDSGEDSDNENVVPIDQLRWNSYADDWGNSTNIDTDSIETYMQLDSDKFADLLNDVDQISIHNWSGLQKIILEPDQKFYDSVIFFNKRLFGIWRNSVNNLSSYTEDITTSPVSAGDTIYSYVDDIFSALYHTFTMEFSQLLDPCTTSLLLKSLAMVFVHGVAFNVLYKCPDSCGHETIYTLHKAIFNKLKNLQSMKNQYVVSLNSRVGVQSIMKVLAQSKNITSKNLSFFGGLKVPTMTSLLTNSAACAILFSAGSIYGSKKGGNDGLLWVLWACLGKAKGW